MNDKIKKGMRWLTLAVGKDAALYILDRVETTLNKIITLEEKVARLESKAHAPCSCSCADEE